jgi:hypothetical protein
MIRRVVLQHRDCFVRDRGVRDHLPHQELVAVLADRGCRELREAREVSVLPLELAEEGDLLATEAHSSRPFP